MIADMLSNKKFNSIVTKSFTRGRGLSISLLFITQSYFVAKIFRLNSTYYFIMNIPNKQELQEIASHHSWDIEFKVSMNLHKKCPAKAFFFLVIDTTLASDNSLCFRKNPLERI